MRTTKVVEGQGAYRYRSALRWLDRYYSGAHIIAATLFDEYCRWRRAEMTYARKRLDAIRRGNRIQTMRYAAHYDACQAKAKELGARYCALHDAYTARRHGGFFKER